MQFSQIWEKYKILENFSSILQTTTFWHSRLFYLQNWNLLCIHFSIEKIKHLVLFTWPLCGLSGVWASTNVSLSNQLQMAFDRETSEKKEYQRTATYLIVQYIMEWINEAGKFSLTYWIGNEFRDGWKFRDSGYNYIGLQRQGDWLIYNYCKTTMALPPLKTRVQLLLIM